MYNGLKKRFITVLMVVMIIIQLCTAVLAAPKPKVLSLYKGSPTDNIPFRAQNMFPGDYITQRYRVDISYNGGMTVYFHAAVREGYEKLAEVLYCKVEYVETGEVAYDGLMKDMPEYDLRRKVHTDYPTTEALNYDISAYLKTSVGNAYQNTDLVADFTWYVLTKPNYGGGEIGGGGGVVIISPSKDGDPDSKQPFKPEEIVLPVYPPEEPVDPDNPPVDPDVPPVDPDIPPVDPDVPPVDPDVPPVDPDVPPVDPDVPPVDPDVPPVDPDVPPVDPDVPPVDPDVPPIDPDVPPVEPDDGELVEPPKTGDTSNMLLWTVVMIVSVLVILVVILLIKRAVGKDKPTKTAKHFTFGIITILILMICLILTTYALVYDYVMVEENIFRTGVVKINLNDGDAIIHAHEHRFEPGVTVVKDFFIENLSSSDVYYRLYLDNMDGDLGDFLEVTIKDGDRVLFHGKPAQLTKLNFEADTLYLDEKRWLTCTFHFPINENNDGESRDMGFNLCAEAVQTKNNPDKVFE